MESIELLKAQLDILGALPDYYDAATRLLQKMDEIEKEHWIEVNARVEQVKKLSIDQWVEVLSKSTKFAIFEGTAYKITIDPIGEGNAIPHGEKVLYVQKY